jgi:glycosyltransferase involved in cell wall biosynthesis
MMLNSRTELKACVLAASPFEIGGIESLSWRVYESLTGHLGSRAVGMAALVGAAQRNDARADALLNSPRYPLSLRGKVEFASWVVRQLATRHPSALLICMHPNQAQVALVARRWRGTPYVVWAHGGEVWDRMQTLPRLALRRANLVFCSSDFTRSRVIDRQHVLPDRAITVYPPVSDRVLQRAAQVKRTAGQAPPVILSVGRVARGYEYKGFDNVIRALPLIGRRVPQVRYVLIGGGDGIEDLRRLASRVGAADRLEFRGPVSDERLWDAYEEIRVFALPSRARLDRITGGEGFGIVYAEAAAFGRPVVGSIQGGAAEALLEGQTGRAVDPTNVNAIADVLIELLLDPELADRYGKAGKTRVLAEFTPTRFGRRLIDSLSAIGVL